MNHSRIIETVDLEKLDCLAIQLPRYFPPQMAVGLVGTLGSGKTTFVQRIAYHLGLDPAEVTSPTFTLLQSHAVKMPGEMPGPAVLNHLDAYRLTDEDEFWELGVDELFDQPGWTLVEWADQVESAMPRNSLWVRLELDDHDLRRIELSSTDRLIAKAIDQLDFDRSSEY